MNRMFLLIVNGFAALLVIGLLGFGVLTVVIPLVIGNQKTAARPSPTAAATQAAAKGQPTQPPAATPTPGLPKECEGLEGDALDLCKQVYAPPAATDTPTEDASPSGGTNDTGGSTVSGIKTQFSGEASSNWAKVILTCESCTPQDVKVTEGDAGFLAAWLDLPLTSHDVEKIEGGYRIDVHADSLKPETTYSYKLSGATDSQNFEVTGKFRTASEGFSLPNVGLPSLGGWVWVVICVAGLLIIVIFLAWLGGWFSHPPKTYTAPRRVDSRAFGRRRI